MASAFFRQLTTVHSCVAGDVFDQVASRHRLPSIETNACRQQFSVYKLVSGPTIGPMVHSQTETGVQCLSWAWCTRLGLPHRGASLGNMLQAHRSKGQGLALRVPCARSTLSARPNAHEQTCCHSTTAQGEGKRDCKTCAKGNSFSTSSDKRQPRIRMNSRTKQDSALSTVVVLLQVKLL